MLKSISLTSRTNAIEEYEDKLSPVVVYLPSGEYILCKSCKIENSNVIILKEPIVVDPNEGGFTYRKFNPFTSDEYFFMERPPGMMVNVMSDSIKLVYKEMKTKCFQEDSDDYGDDELEALPTQEEKILIH